MSRIQTRSGSNPLSANNVTEYENITIDIGISTSSSEADQLQNSADSSTAALLLWEENLQPKLFAIDAYLGIISQEYRKTTPRR